MYQRAPVISRLVPLAAAALACALAGAACDPQPPVGGEPGPAAGAAMYAPAVGSWRILSERIYYDEGGAGSTTVPVTRSLELDAAGRWRFGTSNGSWSVAQLAKSDWERWDVESYGAAGAKLMLDNWDGAAADGPIELDDETPSFLWVIYRSRTEPTGTIWLKFGRR